MNVTPVDQIKYGIALVNIETHRKLEEWFATGVILTDQGIEWKPPRVEVSEGGGIVIHEQLRFL